MDIKRERLELKIILTFVVLAFFLGMAGLIWSFVSQASDTTIPEPTFTTVTGTVEAYECSSAKGSEYIELTLSDGSEYGVQGWIYFGDPETRSGGLFDIQLFEKQLAAGKEVTLTVLADEPYQVYGLVMDGQEWLSVEEGTQQYDTDEGRGTFAVTIMVAGFLLTIVFLFCAWMKQKDIRLAEQTQRQVND